MVRHLIFAAIALGCLGYSLVRGGAPERVCAAIFLASLALTAALARAYAARFHSPEVGVFVADLVTLVALGALALFANRFWTLWVTAMQGVSVLIHVVIMTAPDVFPSAYAFGVAIWSYPMLLLLACGTWRHRQRLRRTGVDRSWSSFSSR